MKIKVEIKREIDTDKFIKASKKFMEKVGK